MRREVLLNNAFLRAQTDLKYRQEERQKRWRELKPLFDLETKMAPAHNKMDAAADKMADDDDCMDGMERPSTPLPSMGASKRQRCGCDCYSQCPCCRDSSAHLSKKLRANGDDDDLKSLDRFLLSLHCNSRQIG